MVQVYVVPQSPSPYIENGPNEEQKIPEAATRDIEHEKNTHDERAKERMETFRKILDNTCSEFNSLLPCITSFMAIVISILAISFYTLIAVSNVIEYPEKWFQYPLQCLFSLWPIYAGHILFDSIYFLNVDIIRSLRAFGYLYIATVFASCLLFSFGYIIWTTVCGLRYPIPLIGYINFFTCTATCLTSIWFQFPIAWRKNEEFRKRLRWNVLAIGTMNLSIAEYIGMSIALVSINKEYQWIIAVFLPFLRFFNVWIIQRMAQNCHGGDSLGGKIYITQALYNAHAYFIAYSIGSAATLMTSSVLIAGDFIINVAISLRMVYLQNKEDNRQTLDERIYLLQELVVSELTETLTPLTYLACLMMAYYGPNAETIGNVKNSWFHFIAIEDFGYTIKFIAIFFFVDLGSLLITAGILWKFCRINLYKAFAALQTEFGLAFGQNLAVLVVSVRNHIKL